MRGIRQLVQLFAQGLDLGIGEDPHARQITFAMIKIDLFGRDAELVPAGRRGRQLKQVRHRAHDAEKDRQPSAWVSVKWRLCG